ncbi:hypothetical protein GCM10023322_63840 [Rugosimonospora acidiphila]|uniref:VOC domain-containing protein n=1 Tax=Rugosimonospora acidiphila TaxID=556531 RepID=A0ABP9SJ50_9ACTN
MIRWSYAFIDRPMDQFARAAEFWTAATATHLSERRGTGGEFVTLLPSQGDACLKLQGVGDEGGAHLDLNVEDVSATVARARALGATVAAPYGDWAVLRSPGGLPFCVLPYEAGVDRPPVVVTQDGAGSRLDQVCLDIAPAAYDAEVAFWLAPTGWRPQNGSHAEFIALDPPPELPVRILLQRLEAARPASTRLISAHLDLACSDVEAVRDWHERLGARLVARYSDWLVMRDPAGGTYCLTRRDPETGDRSTA